MSAVELRPPTVDDVPDLVAFLHASAAQDGLGGVTDAEVRHWFDIPGFDAEHDARIAFEGGRVVAYADLTAEEGERGLVFLDARGDVAAVLDWAEERTRRLASEPKLVTQAWSEYPAKAALLEEHGYRSIRHSFEMQIEFERKPERPQWLPETTVRTFEPGADDRALYDLHTDTFADAWMFEQASYERWRHWHVDRDDFDPSLCFLTEAAGELTGFSMCRTKYADHDGWVSLVGVRRPWRRRGLGLALLRHSFAVLWERGARNVGLGVDAASPTGATRLYERAGMHVLKQFTTYMKEL